MMRVLILFPLIFRFKLVMTKSILIQGCGVLYSEIILTALQEYKTQCKMQGYHCRADVVSDIISAIKFDL